MGRNFDKK